MARLNLRNFLTGAAQAASSYLAGQTAGEAELRRRKQEEEDKRAAYDALVMQMAPQFGKDVQAVIYRNIFANAARRAGIQEPEVPYARRPGVPPWFQGAQAATPALPEPAPTMLPQQGPPLPAAGPALPPGVFGPAVPAGGPSLPPGVAGPAAPVPLRVPQPMAPTATLPPVPAPAPTPAPSPGAAPAAPTRPTVRIPGYGIEAPLRGVNIKEAERVKKDIEGAARDIFRRVRTRDPKSLEYLRGIYEDMPKKPVSEWTEEEMTAAQRVQTNLRSAAMIMGGGEWEAELDEKAAKRIETSLPKLADYEDDDFAQAVIGLKNQARDMQKRGTVLVPPALMAQSDEIEALEAALERGDKRQAALLTGLIRGALREKAKPEDLRKEFDSLLTQMPRWATLTPEAQAPYIRRLRALAPRFGVDPETIPDVIDTRMTEWQKQQLQISRKRVSQAETAQKSLERHRKWQRRHAEKVERRQERESNLRRRSEAGNLTEAEQKRVQKIEAERSSLYQRRNKILETMPVDLTPGKENAASKRINAIDTEIERLNGAIETILKSSEGRGTTTPTTKRGGGKAETGAMIRELASPNRPENKARGQRREKYRGMSDEEFLRARPGR